MDAHAARPSPAAPTARTSPSRCRLPPDLDGPRKFWDFLVQGRNAAGDLPAWRWEPYEKVRGCEHHAFGIDRYDQARCVLQELDARQVGTAQVGKPMPLAMLPIVTRRAVCTSMSRVRSCSSSSSTCNSPSNCAYCDSGTALTFTSIMAFLAPTIR